MSQRTPISLRVCPEHDLLVFRFHPGNRRRMSEEELQGPDPSAVVALCGVSYALFDLTELEYINGSLVMVIFRVLRVVCGERRGAVLVANLKPIILEYFTITQLGRILVVCKDEAEALTQIEAFRSGSKVPFRMKN